MEKSSGTEDFDQLIKTLNINELIDHYKSQPYEECMFLSYL